MIMRADGRGETAEMAYLTPGNKTRTPSKLTATQVKHLSNLIGSWLVYAVGLSIPEAARVLSRSVTERRLRTIVHAMAPVAALPDPHGFANGWRFQIGPAKAKGKPRRTRARRRPNLPRRAPAGRGRTITEVPTISVSG